MISIIICSVNETLLRRLKQNIADTIGVEYELLVWDNRHENFGICKVYNMLAEQAKYKYICFIHEDIVFQNNDWGQIIRSTFEQEKSVAVIGLAGSKYKSSYFSGWYSGNLGMDCINITHRNSNTDQMLFNKPTPQKKFEEVVCIDGVFIATKKGIWEKNKFNEKELTGFHFYDLDFSLNARSFGKVIVTYDIQVIHITKGGNFGEEWLNIAISFHQNHRNALPISVHDCYTDNSVDKRIIRTWLDILKNYEIRFKSKWNWIIYQKLYQWPSFYYSIIKFVLYRPLGLKRIHKWRK